MNNVMKKVLITGSSSGIGRSITEALLAVPLAVIGLARNHQKFQPEGVYDPYVVDFCAIPQLIQQLEPIKADHIDLDALICCAGYGRFKELENFSDSEIHDVMNVNFLSQVMVIKTFLPYMKQRGTGKIIILGSECGLQGRKKASVYAASKFALRGFAQSLAEECRSANIAVTMINPGITRTPFYDNLSFQPGEHKDNAIEPEQIADLICHLLNISNNSVVEEINLQPMKKVIRKKK